MYGLGLERVTGMTLDLDATTLTDTAFTILNAFWPLIALIGGLTIGFALVSGIPKMFKSVF